MEQPGTDGSIPFLNTKVTPGPNNTIHTTVYRKPTHADLHLHWDSNHFIAAKHSVYNTLAHRAKVVSSNPRVSQGTGSLKQSITSLSLPHLTLNKLQHQFEHKHNNNREANSTEEQCSYNHNSSVTTNHNKHRNISMVVPYVHGWERSSRGLAINRVYKFLLRKQTSSSNLSWHQKTRTVNFKKWDYLQIQMPTYQLHRRIHR